MERQTERATAEHSEDEGVEQAARGCDSTVEALAAQGTGADGQPSELEMFLASMLSNSTGMTEELLRENGMELPSDDGSPRVAERPLLPEEAQLVAERSAVQAVLDDVRRCSEDGKLVTPERWNELGLAPAHMDEDAFATFVFDCLDAGGTTPFEGSGLPVDLEIYPDPRDVNGADDDTDADAGGNADADDGTDVETSSDAETDDSDLEVVDAPTGEASAVNAAPAVGDAAGDAPAPTAAADANASVSAPTDVDALAAADAPQDEREVEYVEPAALEHVHDPLACDDIRVLEGSHDVYLYSSERMSDNYAHWAYLADEGDDVLTLVDNTRQECKIYPRPMLARSLTNAPYNFTLDHVYGVFRQVQESGAYPDIQQCSASNGDVYFYSTDYFSAAQARSLAEWYSVEKAMNV